MKNYFSQKFKIAFRILPNEIVINKDYLIQASAVCAIDLEALLAKDMR